MYGFTFDPSQRPHIRPASEILHLVTVFIRCVINPLYFSSSHTKKQREASNSNPFFELSAGRRGLSTVWCYKSQLESSCQPEREDWAVHHVTSTRHAGKFSHCFQDLLKFADKKTKFFQILPCTFSHKHAGGYVPRPKPRFHFCLNNNGKHTHLSRPSHVSADQSRHRHGHARLASSVPVAIPDTHPRVQRLLLNWGKVFFSCCCFCAKEHVSCSPLNRADQFSDETQPSVEDSGDAHAFTYSWGQQEKVRLRRACVCMFGV